MFSDEERRYFLRDFRSFKGDLNYIADRIERCKKELDDDAGDSAHACKRFLSLAVDSLNDALDSILKAEEHLPEVVTPQSLRA